MHDSGDVAPSVIEDKDVATGIHDSVGGSVTGFSRILLLLTWIWGAGEREKLDTVFCHLNRRDLITAILSAKKKKMLLSFLCLLQNSQKDEVGQWKDFVHKCIYNFTWFTVIS